MIFLIANCEYFTNDFYRLLFKYFRSKKCKETKRKFVFGLLISCFIRIKPVVNKTD